MKGRTPAKTPTAWALFVDLSVFAYRFVYCLGVFACESAVKNSKRKTRRYPPLVGGLGLAYRMQAKQSTMTARHGRATRPHCVAGFLTVNCGGRRRDQRASATKARCAGRAARGIARLLGYRLSRAAVPFISTLDKLDYPKKSKPAQAEYSAWACFLFL